MMVGADAARFVLIGAIPVAVWAGVARIELLCVLVFAAGVLTVLYQLADFAFLPGLVGKGRLVDANARLAASQSATEIGGKGLGGLLVDVLSAPVAVLADALSYLASALLLSGVPDADPPAREPAAPRSRRQETSKACGWCSPTATSAPCSARPPPSTCATRSLSSACCCTRPATSAWTGSRSG
jgi:hypothetical protein